MTLALLNRWVWSFWLARDGVDWHIFFLQADRALVDPDLRHRNASVGHAVSTDLRNWQYLGTCLYPSASPAWDDGTVGSGCVIKHQNLWHLFFTGTSRSESGTKQRIGLATSDDLHHWQRHHLNPILDIDKQFYEECEPGFWGRRSFGNPWVAADPSGDGFRMWFSARSKSGPSHRRGVIGTARSSDLIKWQAEPPVTKPGDFGEVEAVQFLTLGDHCYLLCTAGRSSTINVSTTATPHEEPQSGTHYFIADRVKGPWRLDPSPLVCGDQFESLTAGRIVNDPGGNPKFLGSLGVGSDGLFRGTISDPLEAIVGSDGRLTLEANQHQQRDAMPPTDMAAA